MPVSSPHLVAPLVVASVAIGCGGPETSPGSPAPTNAASKAPHDDVLAFDEEDVYASRTPVAKPAEDVKRSRETIRATMQHLFAELRRLHGQVLKNKPTFRGKLTLEFSVASNGQAHDVKLVQNELLDEEFVNAVSFTIQAQPFPRAAEGAPSLRVRYPLVFSPRE